MKKIISLLLSLTILVNMTPCAVRAARLVTEDAGAMLIQEGGFPSAAEKMSEEQNQTSGIVTLAALNPVLYGQKK